MTTAGDHPLDTPIEGLLATPTSRLPYQHNVLLRSYVLERPQGNLVVYNSPGVSESAAAILALGAPARLLVNHGHESMYGQPDLDVPIWVHRDDRSELATSLDVTGTFDGPGMIDDDLEVIPTPGHTAGTTSYLWDNGTHRFLFTGDFIWIEDGEWKAVVLSSGLRRDYLDSLALVRELDFDVLVPWGTTEGDPPYGLVPDPAQRHDRIDAIIDRVEAGGDR
ncbi:MBL fold metallo-hydrolase [Modestobacter sp. VKM Ac-2979]|uniref:MBL fold metallo-hydrolase n=1 Tax=unclassified Modestobacter TaxID=2643866 RepID=UPI0022ABA5E4|nr:MULTISPECIES: MBL fold metallo-hydrolase [unclassified Modestobacter]MCZ2813246.1 MBL fold metallo-hydrolase [Modestobacter sp. VKM Ac-2979]MCZ2844862.1 MBL fold metallo-hydrolase [Modestobacter sp. VKM Ac-2980]